MASHRPLCPAPDALRATRRRSADVLESCGVDRATFRAFVAAVRAAQPDNAFHNVWHVCDVLHSVRHAASAARSAATVCNADTPPRRR